MTFILSKKSKPKLVDISILNQITKQNLLKKQIINSEKSKYQLLLNTIHDKCIDFITNYFWIIIIFIIIIYILWCRYKWYQESLKKKFTYFDDDYTLQYNLNNQNKYNLNNQKHNHNDNYQLHNLNNQKHNHNDKYQQNNLNNQKHNHNKYNLNNHNHNHNQKHNQNKYNLNNHNQNKYNLNNQKHNQNKYNLNNEVDIYQQNNEVDIYQQNNEINILDNQKINTQYTNKKDIKYNNNNNNNIKVINFDTINNTFYDPISNNNSNYSFI